MIRFCFILNLLVLVSCSTLNPQQSKLQKDWDILCSYKTCLHGSHNFGEGNDKGNAFENKKWQFFLKKKDSTFRFLINKLDSSQNTRIHICGFRYAKENEVAVFFMHYLFHKNWFECGSKYPTLYKYALQKDKGKVISLEEVLNNSDAKNELREFFTNLMAESIQTLKSKD